MDRNVTRVNILHNSERLFFARNGTVLRPPQLGFDLRDSRKPAAYPYKWISTLFHTSTYLPNAVEVWPHAQSRLCCPARHHFKAIPTSLRPSHESCRFHPTWNVLTAGGVLRRRWDLRSYLRYLSPHAIGHTPGPHQVLLPFPSLMTPAFSQIIEDRRVSPLRGVYPSTGLSQLCPSSRHLRSCTIRFMLRPAVLAGTPDWVKPATSASRLGTVSGQVQPMCYHTNPPSACRVEFRRAQH